MSTDSSQFLIASLRASFSRWDTQQITTKQLFNSLSLAMMSGFQLLLTAVLSELKSTTFIKRVSEFLSLEALFSYHIIRR